MDTKEFRNILEKSTDKFSTFTDKKMLSQWEMNTKELISVISDFLSDEEKLRLFEIPAFAELSGLRKSAIINTVSDTRVKLQMLLDDNVMKGIEKYRTVSLVNSLDDNSKKAILYNQEFLKKQDYKKDEIKKVLFSLGEDTKRDLLLDNNYVEGQLHLPKEMIANIAKDLQNEDSKLNIIDTYELESKLSIVILNTFGDESKAKVILEDKLNFLKEDTEKLISSLDIEHLSEFLLQNKEFMTRKKISPYQVIKLLDSEKQLEFLEKLEDCEMSLSEKRQILVALKPETKEKIDTTNFSEEYKSAISIDIGEYNRIELDLNRDIEDYKGLDDLLFVNPLNFDDAEREKFYNICSIYPNLTVVNTISEANPSEKYFSTAREYQEGEDWISSIIDNLNPEWTDAQKLAVIDNEIGKKVSYSPDFQTEVSDSNDCRALWKIINSRYGVCNGIAKLENYMLKRIGIESECVSSKTHVFLKVKDIELPLASGETVRGNTILDPTWNLTNHKFGGQPDNFCRSYEEIRKNDIDSDHKDHNSHKNDEKLADCTVELDKQSLKQLFASVGLLDKEGNFPIKSLINKSEYLDKLLANSPDENIQKQFLLLEENFPEFATCQNSSMRILSEILLNKENLQFNKCVANRVYDRNDDAKRPILYVYIDSEELGKRFYFADKDKGSMVELPQEEFITRFECYEIDMKKSKGYRPWEVKGKEKEDTDLNTTSGSFVAERGDER